MGLLGNGYKIIADEFGSEVNRAKLIGVSFPEDGNKVFRGVFDTRPDLVAAYPPNEETIGNFAFVKAGDTGGDTSAGYYRVIVNLGGNSSWVRAEEDNINDVKYHIYNEDAWETFVGQTPTFTATTVTNTNTGGTPLKLASPLVFNITSLPTGSTGIMVQGVLFEKYVSPTESYDYYVWGFGTDNWAGFTEPGEFIVSSWNFKLGGFPTTEEV